MYTPIDHLNYGIYLQRRDPFFLCGIIYTVQHLHAAKPYLGGGRPKPFKPTYLLPLYTLIHLARSNTLAARVLGLGVP